MKHCNRSVSVSHSVSVCESTYHHGNGENGSFAQAVPAGQRTNPRVSQDLGEEKGEIADRKESESDDSVILVQSRIVKGDRGKTKARRSNQCTSGDGKKKRLAVKTKACGLHGYEAKPPDQCDDADRDINRSSPAPPVGCTDGPPKPEAVSYTHLTLPTICSV